MAHRDSQLERTDGRFGLPAKGRVCERKRAALAGCRRSDCRGESACSSPVRTDSDVSPHEASRRRSRTTIGAAESWWASGRFSTTFAKRGRVPLWRRKCRRGVKKASPRLQLGRSSGQSATRSLLDSPIKWRLKRPQADGQARPDSLPPGRADTPRGDLMPAGNGPSIPIAQADSPSGHKARLPDKELYIGECSPRTAAGWFRSRRHSLHKHFSIFQIVLSLIERSGASAGEFKARNSRSTACL